MSIPAGITGVLEHVKLFLLQVVVILLLLGWVLGSSSTRSRITEKRGLWACLGGIASIRFTEMEILTVPWAGDSWAL